MGEVVAARPHTHFCLFGVLRNFSIPKHIGTENHVHFLPLGKRLPRQATKKTRQRGRPTVASLDSPPLDVRPPPAADAPWRGLVAGGFSRGRLPSDGCPQVRRSAALAGVMFALPLACRRAIHGLVGCGGHGGCHPASLRPVGSPSLGAPSPRVRRGENVASLGGRLGVGRAFWHDRKLLSPKEKVVADGWYQTSVGGNRNII